MIEVLKQALDLIVKSKRYAEECSHIATQSDCDHFDAVAENLRKAIQEEALRNVQRIGQEIEQEPEAVYGYCPECGAKGVMRERRPDGNDKCANGHTYQSCKATQQPQRTWVGLTDEEVDDLAEFHGLDFMSYDPFTRAIEAKLKELNS